MARPELTPQLVLLEEAVTILFCRVDDTYYRLINPKGRRYQTLKELSDSEVITLALFQQLRGVESERSFLREVARFFSHLFPGAVGLHPSSFHRRVRKLRRHFEPLRKEILPELVGEPETLIVDSTLLAVLHPREVAQSGGWGSSSAGAGWVRWGSFSVYGVKLHLICATNRVPISYELTPANTADLSLTEELFAQADLGSEVARKLLGDLAYRSAELEEELAELGISCWLPTKPVPDGLGSASRSRSPFRASSEPSGWGDFGHHAGGIGHKDRSQDDRLHLCVLGQPASGSSSRKDQGTVGVNLATLI
jgi:Transposase DDE domain